MKRIPLFRFRVSEATRKNVDDALSSGMLSNTATSYQDKLVDWWKGYTGHQYAVPVCSGTAAVRAALFACLGGHYGEGKVVATTDYCCVADLMPIVEFRAEPIFCAVELQTYGMMSEAVTRAIVDHGASVCLLPYLYGEKPADAEAVGRVCRDANVPLIADVSECVGMASEAFVGDVVVASLRTEKMLGSAEGGIVSTNDPHLARLIEMFVNRGKPSSRVKYWVASYGDNVRMSNMTAAVACGQTSELSSVVAGKRRVAERYRRGPLGVEVGTFQRHDPEVGVAWLNMLVVDPEVIRSVSDLAVFLGEMGVETRPGFYPLQWVYSRVTGKSPVEAIPGGVESAITLWREGIVLPSSFDLTEEEIECVESMVWRFL